uniref:Uncharacterized protein n=1 Tax=Cacopsylla melanoneura TaxID=428564 RepID=A0A8D9DUZ1_9HEMI
MQVKVLFCISLILALVNGKPCCFTKTPKTTDDAEDGVQKNSNGKSTLENGRHTPPKMLLQPNIPQDIYFPPFSPETKRRLAEYPQNREVQIRPVLFPTANVKAVGWKE